MHYYQWNIGDYISHTSHLTDAEDLAYRRMLDLYYLSEEPFALDSVHQIARRIRSTPEIVEAILREFFEIDPVSQFWRNKRADAEIAAYQSKADRARNANRSRWSVQKDVKSDLKLDLKSDLKSDAFQIPNNNHKPLTKEKTTPQAAALFPDVRPEVVADFVKLRRSLRAPITELAVKGIYREAEKAGLTAEQALVMCIERSWRGFKAEWVSAKDRPTSFDWETELRGAI